MTDQELSTQIGRIAQGERDLLEELLPMLCLAEARRSFIKFGCSSLFKWLTTQFKYSNAAAGRRIHAAKLFSFTPSSLAAIKSGALNFSTLAKANALIDAAEEAKRQIDPEAKARVAKQIGHKSVNEVEKILLAQYPEAAKDITKGKSRRMKYGITRCPLEFTDAQLADLKRLREVLSHKLPRATHAELVAHVISEYFKREDPLRRSAADQTPKPSKARTRLAVIQNANAACTYRDPVSGRVCGSRHQVQIDHVKPKALGGDDSPENLRVLCRRHNILVAERTFGEAHMSQFRRAKTVSN